jgi:hypothetical protein
MIAASGRRHAPRPTPGALRNFGDTKPKGRFPDPGRRVGGRSRMPFPAARALAAQRPSCRPVPSPGPPTARAGAGRREPMARAARVDLLDRSCSNGMACAQASTEPFGTRTEDGQHARSAMELGSYDGAADHQSAAQRTMAGRSHPTLHAAGGELRARHVVFRPPETPGTVEHQSGHEREWWSRVPQRPST